MRPLVLAFSLLAAAGSARAADIFNDAKAAGADIKARHEAQADREKQETEAQQQAAAAKSAQVRQDIETLQDADLKIYDLSEAGWTPEQMGQLAQAVRAGSRAVKELHAKYPSAVADAYGNGTMTNIEDTFKLFGGGNLERGCISHQSATIGAVNGARLDKLTAARIMVGKGMEHHAVIVYPTPPEDVRKDDEKLTAWWKRTGVVLDGWRYQTDEPKKMTFTFASWNRTFWSLPYPRLETD